MTHGVPVATALGPARLTAGFDRFRRLDLRAHRRVHPPLEPHDLARLIALAREIGLTGRGGAGFPFARKLEAVADSVRRQGTAPAVVVNATEGEPASWKDKVLLTRAPHLILDGAVLAARALDADRLVVAVADDGVGEQSVTDALAERSMAGHTRVVRVPHRFISGEGGALVRGINGLTPVPPGVKVRASDRGVDGAPTLLSNAETYAQLAIAVRLGARGYAAIGTPDEPGTVLLSVTGSAGRPSVVECPSGTPLRDVLAGCRAPVGPGVLVGGFHGRWLGPDAAYRAEVSRAGLARVHGVLGAGIVVPLGDGTCPVGEAARVVGYLAEQSAGQCGPCRLGLPELARRMAALLTGGGEPGPVRAAAAAVRGRGACHHPDGTADFVLSALDVFAADVAAHAAGHGCGLPVRGVLPLPRPVADGTRRLAVDWTRCEGHGLCAHVAPELIELDGMGYPRIPDRPLPTALEKPARRAVAMCPALALRLTGTGTRD